MNAYISMRIGLGTIRGLWGMVVFLFFVNLLFSLALAVPLFQDLKNSFGTSYVGQTMANDFDYLWWEQSRYGSEGVTQTFSPSLMGKGAILENLEYLLHMRFPSFPPALLALLVLYLLFRTFLTGGVISQLYSRSQKFSLSSFLQGAGMYFLPFFILMLASWFFFYLVGGPLRGKLSIFIKGVSARSYSELPGFWLGLLAGTVSLFLLLFIQMIFDYARIRTVLNYDRNKVASFLKALMFCFRKFGAAMSITYSFLFLNVVLSVCFIVIVERVPQSAFWGILSAFVIQEIFISLIIFLRCWLYSSQIHFYQSSQG